MLESVHMTEQQTDRVYSCELVVIMDDLDQTDKTERVALNWGQD